MNWYWKRIAFSFAVVLGTMAVMPLACDVKHAAGEHTVPNIGAVDGRRIYRFADGKVDCYVVAPDSYKSSAAISCVARPQ